jgi:hypothetical protein
MDITNAAKILEKGKKILEDIVGITVKEKWQVLNKEFEETKAKKKLIGEIDVFIEESRNLKENFLFQELEVNINNLMVRSQKLNIMDYLKKLEVLIVEVNSIKEKYNQTSFEIKSIESQIKQFQNDNLLEDVLKSCKKIIQLSTNIKNSEIIEKYTLTLKQTKKAIEEAKIFKEKQDKLKKELDQLEIKFEAFIKKMALIDAKKIIEKSKVFLVEYVDNEVKKKWDILEKRYLAGRNLIDDVERLSKNGLDALEKKNYNLSLDSFDKIINQLLEYQK